MSRTSLLSRLNRLDRRTLLSLSCLGLPALGLPAPSQGARRVTKPARATSVLLLYMDGGPSHIDMFDLKPAAPAEIRGPAQPIATSVPGITVGEYLPRLAQQMHHVAQIRSVHHEDMPHDQAVYHALTGYRHNIRAGGLKVENTDLPHMASAFDRVAPQQPAMPHAIQIPEPMRIDARILPGQNAGILGARWNPLPVQVSTAGRVQPPDLARIQEVSPARLTARSTLLGQLQNQALLDHVADSNEWAADQDQVLRILQKPSIDEAFDLTRETPALRAAYGHDRHGQSTLLARRLIEAGAGFVTVYWGKEIQDWGGDWKPMLANNPWDTHRNHFPLIKDSLIPRADRTLATLLADLADRGLLETTLVVWMGEFGRSPRISKLFATPGREHWPYAYTVLMAGAGIRGGSIYGATDRYAEYVTENPVSPADITATIFQALGLDHAQTVRVGRKLHRLSRGRPLTELFS